MDDMTKGAELAIELAKIIGKEVYADVAHPPAMLLGKALTSAFSIVLSPVFTVAYPFQWWNNKIFTKNLKDCAERLMAIPQKNLQDVPPEISVPILERFRYVTTDEIRKLYIEILAKAADTSKIHLAHPSFILTIESLSVDDAKIIEFMKSNDDIPYLLMKMQFEQPNATLEDEPKGPGVEMSRELTGLEKALDLRFPDNIPMYLANLVSLGIIAHGPKYLSDIKKYYGPLKKLYESKRKSCFENGHTDGTKYPVLYEKGYFRKTQFGESFIEAVSDGV